MRKCLVCKNDTPGQLSRHHLVGKRIQRDKHLPPQRQMTIKLCKDNLGCQSHRKFHMGNIETAMKIRSRLRNGEIQWMVSLMGSEWVRKTYPTK